MNYINSQTVLLIDENDGGCATESWLETNGYSVRRAANFGDALDEMTDYTLTERPGVILLNSFSSAACVDVMHSLREIDGLSEIPIVALAQHVEFAKGECDDYFVRAENFDALKPLMNSLLPIQDSTQALAA